MNDYGPSDAGSDLPTVSVVIPHYEQSVILQGCIGALSQQDRPPEEIIVVDDGSSRLPELPRLIAQSIPVRLLGANHAGPAAARNLGARSASGDVIAFTDCDCRPEPRWVTAIARFFADHGQVAAVTGPVLDVTAVGPHHPWNPFHQFMLATAHLDAHPQRFEYQSTPMLGMIGANLAIRTSAFKALGGFDTTYRQAGGEDYDLAIRIQQSGLSAAWVPDGIVRHEYPVRTISLLRRWRAYGRGKAQFADKHSIPFARLHLMDFEETPFCRIPSELHRISREHFGAAFSGKRFPWKTAFIVEACFQVGAHEEWRSSLRDLPSAR